MMNCDLDLKDNDKDKLKSLTFPRLTHLTQFEGQDTESAQS